MDRETAEEIKRHFDAAAGALRNEILAVDERLTRHFNATAGALRSDIVAVEDRSRSQITALDEKVESRFEELKRHFDVVGESLRSEIRIVADGFVATNERLDRFEVNVSDRFGEMEAMIRLSFGELAQRIH